MLSFPTWVEIDLDAFKWNLERIRDILPGSVNIMLVVKADAYGHGAVRISKFASGCGVNMLGVATIGEGVQLREAGIKLPILIISPILKDQIGRLIEYDLSASLSTYEFARAASKMAISTCKKCSVHIEVDTGMGRAGLSVAKVSDYVLKISKLEGLVMDGLFTHFPAADSDVEYTRDQINLFSEIVEHLKSKEVTFKYIHSANSAAIINFPESHFNMVRPGLLAYGHTPSVDLRDKIDIRPVMNFKTKLLLARKVLSGESISYGRTYITQKPTIIGTIAAGYGHGMSHRLSNKGEVLFRGRRVPIVGRVTMDMTMVDLYGFEDPRVGEEVVIFGRQGDEEITVDETAQWDGTLNYEVMCRINKRVVRVYIKSGKIDTLKNLQGLHKNI
ncbi:MAG: alanine racemase [Candidatus Krumholzibacteriota bacterium]|nr:alanine racemase [Candidatus Krumholzibacteriota bacterium]